LAKAFVLAVVALLAGLLVYWLAGSHGAAPGRAVAPPASGTGLSSPGAPPGASSSAPPAVDTGPIAPPRTEQEKEHDALEQRRAPLYGRLHQSLGAALTAVQPSDDDPATLDLYAAQDLPGNTLSLLSLALQANVSYYGFRHIRFFAPNPPQSLERYRLDAEANSDGAGNWQTFKK
jgi:hypothetical protein